MLVNVVEVWICLEDIKIVYAVVTFSDKSLLGEVWNYEKEKRNGNEMMRLKPHLKGDEDKRMWEVKGMKEISENE